MKSLLNSIVAVVLAASACAPRIFAETPPAKSGATVSGEIRLVDGKSLKTENDTSGAVVWLVPLDGITPARLATTTNAYRMVQHNKQFEPHLLVVPLGSVVAFPNLDPWFHNVFSLYRGKRFDLGLYEAGSQKQVRFDRPGASYIFCNIHPEMMAVVLAVDTPFYVISDKSGHWSIPNVPPGRYRVHFWDENATPAALQPLGSVVEVGSDAVVLSQVSIPVTPGEWAHHSNLYGRDYDPKTLTPVY
jgi:plastocyanin